MYEMNVNCAKHKTNVPFLLRKCPNYEILGLLFFFKLDRQLVKRMKFQAKGDSIRGEPIMT